MKVAVVGRGKVGTAFAVLLERSGHEVVDAPSEAELVIIATPDERIVEVCSALAGRGELHEGQTVAHVSGATGLAALAAAKEAGAAVLSLHPLQTFPDVESAIERLPGSGMAVTAENEAAAKIGERIAEDLGARPFRLADQDKALYHAAAVFASNYVVTVLAIADELFCDAGLDDPIGLMMPLVRSSVDAVNRLGTLKALTGPVVRGDAKTIERNLEAMRENAPLQIPVYLALARAALDRAARSGLLDTAARRRLDEVLSRWT